MNETAEEDCWQTSNNINNDTVEKTACTEFEFDQSIFKNTIVTKWNLGSLFLIKSLKSADSTNLDPSQNLIHVTELNLNI